MSPQEAADQIIEAVSVSREDICRAKGFILETPESDTDALAEGWLKVQDAVAPTEVHLDAGAADDVLALLSKSCSLRMAFYQAIWELGSSADLLLGGQTSMWGARATWRTDHGAGGLPLSRLVCPYPTNAWRPPLPNQRPQDVDVFLNSLGAGLHAGIREAIKQSLSCYRRGLYLPCLVMLGAGVEAAWIECGSAVAKKLGDARLESTVADPFVGLSRKVAQTTRSLDSAQAKVLLRSAGVSKSRLDDAEVWTTALRGRRNALHWGNAKSFIAESADAEGLLLGAPFHVGTLEAIRNAC